MAYVFAALRALKDLGHFNEVVLLGHKVRTDATDIRPDLAELGPCRCNALVYALCNSVKAECTCTGAFAAALGPCSPKKHLILLYGLKGPEGPNVVIEAHKRLSSIDGPSGPKGLNGGARAIVFFGRHRALNANFKSQQFLTMGHKDPEIIVCDFKKQL